MSHSFNIQNQHICSSIRNWNAYANEARNVNQDSPIVKRNTAFSTRLLIKTWYFFNLFYTGILFFCLFLLWFDVMLFFLLRSMLWSFFWPHQSKIQTVLWTLLKGKGHTDRNIVFFKIVSFSSANSVNFASVLSLEMKISVIHYWQCQLKVFYSFITWHLWKWGINQFLVVLTFCRRSTSMTRTRTRLPCLLE